MRQWHAIGIFCEDIREEARSLHTLLGIMPDRMKVTKIPGGFSKLGMYVRVHVPVETDVGAIDVTIRLPDETESTLAGFTVDQVKEEQQKARENGMLHAGFIMQLVGAGIPIKQAGRLDLVVSVGGDKCVCGSLRIFQDEATSSATASGRQTLQFQPVAPESSS